ncbi:antitoxin VbhA family protein [Bartonella sp. AR 15-3]|uniref:antitoxin VbhA family protein n=1 Tax=Bartonella sp. AR 15-3 TaxID=545617 RepID=UPI0001F4CEF7|nr:antitoxin VbhA family protein [Bartonella sp. AR 15-3]OPB31780.1 FicA antitoxin-like protein BiaA [Bartonella sp. AR 15-3]CBI79184.1 conserved hypothetical protein [Bartonella sp. AR 15-3]
MEKKSTDYSASLIPEELQKRREAVDAAISTHTIEGITLHSKTLEILEGYAKGEYSLEEFNTLMDNATL